MKLINWIKNLFSTNASDQADGVYKGKVKYDIFGNIIQSFEYVYPVVYKDVKRRGYITIEANATGINHDDITDEMLKQGVVRAGKFLGTMYAKKLVESKRKGFYHIPCTVDEIKLQNNG